jgi:hypothetical protein
MLLARLVERRRHGCNESQPQPPRSQLSIVGIGGRLPTRCHIKPPAPLQSRGPTGCPPPTAHCNSFQQQPLRNADQAPKTPTCLTVGSGSGACRIRTPQAGGPAVETPPRHPWAPDPHANSHNLRRGSFDGSSTVPGQPRGRCIANTAQHLRRTTSHRQVVLLPWVRCATKAPPPTGGVELWKWWAGVAFDTSAANMRVPALPPALPSRHLR